MQGYIDILLEMTGNIGATITLAITVVTSTSLLIVNLARYIHAKKYGIPLKMVSQASLPDSLDLWVVFIGAFGFGIFIPNYMTYVDMNIFAVFAVIFASCFASLLLLHSKSTVVFNTKRGGRIELSISGDGGVWILAIISLVATCAFVYIRYVDHNLTVDYENVGNLLTRIALWVASAVRRIHRGIVLFLFIVGILAKIYGEKDVVTVDIGNQIYLLAMRHNTSQWVLIPCTLEEKEQRDGNVDKIVKFIKGKFIIRDMSLLKGLCPVTCRAGYAVLGVTEDEDTKAGEDIQT